ncbi:hypothetical protein HNY73_017173 [Argiope bruennichi]|uniref:Uncharacterized protein n=1 Tax=Argiope bruennichi TaxID=94029 RepID=A0A8T0EKR1_ARGBR|nr:hypothetical protein HNY73_017173 [Argiope bruennichi]
MEWEMSELRTRYGGSDGLGNMRTGESYQDKLHGQWVCELGSRHYGGGGVGNGCASWGVVIMVAWVMSARAAVKSRRVWRRG